MSELKGAIRDEMPAMADFWKSCRRGDLHAAQLLGAALTREDVRSKNNRALGLRNTFDWVRRLKKRLDERAQGLPVRRVPPNGFARQPTGVPLLDEEEELRNSSLPADDKREL